MINKVVKVIDSCETIEQLQSAKNYVDLYCDYMRREHCETHTIDCEMLEISFDMLYDKIKEKDIWKK